MAQPEKINIWERWFNRYRKEIHNRGSDTWHMVRRGDGVSIPNSNHNRDWIEYKIIDRVTGSEKIEREYLS